MTEPDLVGAARWLVRYADALDGGQRPPGGRLRDIARHLIDCHDQLEQLVAVTGRHRSRDGCRCGRPIEQPPTGRPRKYCTTCSPPRLSRKTR